MKGIAQFCVVACLSFLAFAMSLIGDITNSATRHLRRAVDQLQGVTRTPPDSRHEATLEDGERYASITLIGYHCSDDTLQDYVGQQLTAIVQRARQEHAKVPASPRRALPKNEPFYEGAAPTPTAA